MDRHCKTCGTMLSHREADYCLRCEPPVAASSTGSPSRADAIIKRHPRQSPAEKEHEAASVIAPEKAGESRTEPPNDLSHEANNMKEPKSEAANQDGSSALASAHGSASDSDDTDDPCNCDYETAWERVADGIRWLLIWLGIGLAAGIAMYGCSFLAKP